ncbi:MAG: diguanylate cyclase [Campylobacterota bacterium]
MKKTVLLFWLFTNVFFAQDTDKKVYNVIVVSDLAPYYFYHEGEPAGYGVEVFESIAQKTGIDYRFVRAEDIKTAYAMIEQGRADIMPNSAIGPKNKNLMVYTQPTDSCQIDLFYNKNRFDIEQKNDLQNRSLAVINRYPCAEIIPSSLVSQKVAYPNIKQALLDLREGKIDMVAHPKKLGETTIARLGLNTRNYTSFTLTSGRRGVGIANEHFELLPLFDDAITQMQLEGELNMLRQKWFEDVRIALTYKEIFIISVFALVAFGMLVVFILITGIKRRWVHTTANLQAQVDDKTKQLQHQYETINIYKRRLESVMDSISDLIFYKDENLRYIGCNKTFCEYADKSAGQIIGKTDYEIFDKDLADLIRSIDEEILQNRHSRLRGDWVSFPARQNVYIQTSIMPFAYDRKHIGVLGVSRDNTQLRLAQKRIANQRYIDELTGLNNRKSYNKRIHELLYAHNRYGDIFSVIMYDIDNFKKINDTYGHKVGDDVLKQMSAMVQKSIRTTDFLFRIGGEEFIILLAKTPLEEAKKTAQKIRKNIAGQLHTIKDKQITVSLGVTQVQPGDDEDRIFQRVDSLLYEAKHAGKDRVKADKGSVV